MKLLEAFARQNVTYACFFTSLQHWGYQIIITGYQRIIIGDMESIINGLHGPGLDFLQPIYRNLCIPEGVFLKEVLVLPQIEEVSNKQVQMCRDYDNLQRQ